MLDSVGKVFRKDPVSIVRSRLKRNLEEDNLDRRKGEESGVGKEDKTAENDNILEDFKGQNFDRYV